MELRCEEGVKHAEMGDDFIEVKCRSRFCGSGSGVVVLHRFSRATGELMSTKRFADPLPANGK